MHRPDGLLMAAVLAPRNTTGSILDESFQVHASPFVDALTGPPQQPAWTGTLSQHEQE
jgi:hypothetical protein